VVVTEHLLRPAALAFLEVGVFVAPLLLLFGLLQWRTRGRLLSFLDEHPRLGPLAGALLGAMPGCGGAIVLMPVYLRGGISFGTIVAALVATMGDSSFVLIAADPVLAVAVHALLLVVGLVAGYVVDALGLAPRPQVARPPRLVPARPSTVGAAAAVPPLLGRSPVLRFPLLPLVAFWCLVAGGLAVGVPVVLGLSDGPEMARHLRGVDPVLLVGGMGIALTLAVFASGRAGTGEPGRGTALAGSLREVLTDSARETAFVTAWVAAAFVAIAGISTLTGTGLLTGAEGAGAALAGRAGLLAVLAGAAVGLIPGCGPQIVLTGLYVQGALPLSVLAANALSQDGDALFPLLAGNRRAALLGTAVSTVPGVLVGGILWAVGW
jgi:hypothetical protein